MNQIKTLSTTLRYLIFPCIVLLFTNLHSITETTKYDSTITTSTVTTPPQAEWTLMIYAQADTVLNTYAIKNLNAMSTVGSNEKLNIIVQWNQPKRYGTWRYRIEKGEIKLLQSTELSKPTPMVEDLIDFSDFCVKHYPAKQYAFIFWNHGVGIIDPEWTQLHQFSVSSNTSSPQQGPCAVANDGYATFSIRRGILFDMANRNYLNNQELVKALDYITKNILHRKFDIIGMDACLMAMFEIFYQIREFADYCVSSEEVELAQGWNYTPFLETLASTSLNSPMLARHIVSTFGEYYRGKTQFFTQSAIQLDTIDYIKHNLDIIVRAILQCHNLDNYTVNTMLTNARKQCLQLTTSCYIDLHSFYSELLSQITTFESNMSTMPPKTTIGKSERSRNSSATTRMPIQDLIHASPLQDLKNALIIGITLIENTVIANVASSYLGRAKGISIYFPYKTIDSSYYKTKFAQDSLWVDFLQQTMGCKARA